MTAIDHVPAIDLTRAVELGEVLPVSAARLRELRSRVPSSASEVIEVRAPYTGQVFADVPAASAEDVNRAVASARRLQPAWAMRSVDARAKVLRRFAALVRERQEEILDLIQLETGKLRAHAFEEVADVVIVAEHYARAGKRLLAPKSKQGALPLLTSTQQIVHPKGVVGFIAPWNYPLSMAITDAIPALLAGNAAIIKPAAQTPYTALWAVELLEEAGLPRGLAHVLTGRGSVVGTAIIDACDFVTFTGSTETGRTVAAQAGENLIGCALELGGKNALLVLDDADVDQAVDIAVRGAFANAGQLCISFERIYVHESMAVAFRTRLVEAIEAMELTAGYGWKGDMGSLISQDQLDTVLEHVRDAVEKGADVLTGGMPRPDVGPWFHAPTVLSGVTPEMTVFAEETFGPVVSLYEYRSDDEAIQRINASRYGLNAAVVTRDTRRGRALAARIEAGTVNVNEAYAAAWASVDAPMGGFKDSGLGRRHGDHGILKYTEVQTIATQRVMPVSRLPFLDAEKTAAVLTHAINVMYRIPGLRR